MKQTILLIDDELALLRTLKERLEIENFTIITCTDAEQGVKTLSSSTPDLMIVDIRLPGMNGLDFCRHVRAMEGPVHSTPVIFLTTTKDESYKVLGLELGGDDYITKPFNPAELVARVRALLRRSRMFSGENEEVLSSGPAARRLTINCSRHEACISGRALDLSPKEFELLYLLVKKRGRVLTRPFIMERIWGREYEQTTRTIDTHIKHLRKSLGAFGNRIRTIEGLGYKWEDPE